MPFVEYTTAARWVQIARIVAERPPYSHALQRYGIDGRSLEAVLTAESELADEAGRSAAAASHVATRAGVPVRTVLLIRAGLSSAGLMANLEDGAHVQLQLPRGTGRSRP